jgi:serine phosphatase RsbU (regulator of sigma subunit)
MDVAICKINHLSNTLEYAGAMRPLWLIEEKELKEIKADKIPIGTKQKDREETILFHTHIFQLKGQSSFYIFTDGYADQFGGPKEKKYSSAKFKELLLNHHHLPMAQQAEAIKEEHVKWKGRHEQVDDILVIGFKL